MKKGLLNEIKAMNKIAGTQLTKEQEIALIRERLKQLNELDFGTQKAFDSYQKAHNLRPDTKVTVAGKAMSAGQAAKQSKDPAVNKVKGTAVFGGKSKPSDSQQKPAADHKDMVSSILKNTEYEEADTYKISEVGSDMVDGLETGDSDVNRELIKKLKNKDEGTYVQTHEMGGNLLFNNGDHYSIRSNEGGDIHAIKLSDIKGPKPSDKGWSSADLMDAKFDDPDTGLTVRVGRAFEKGKGSAYEKAEEYLSLFNPDDEELITH